MQQYAVVPPNTSLSTIGHRKIINSCADAPDVLKNNRFFPVNIRYLFTPLGHNSSVASKERTGRSLTQKLVAYALGDEDIGRDGPQAPRSSAVSRWRRPKRRLPRRPDRPRRRQEGSGPQDSRPCRYAGPAVAASAASKPRQNSLRRLSGSYGGDAQAPRAAVPLREWAGNRAAGEEDSTRAADAGYWRPCLIGYCGQWRCRLRERR